MGIKTVNWYHSLRRRRRGTTSPPLVNVEWNPGPKNKATRRKDHKGPSECPNERPSHFTKFKATRDLGRHRTYAAVARRHGVKEETVARLVAPKQPKELKAAPTKPAERTTEPARVAKARKHVEGQTPQTSFFERGAMAHGMHQGQSDTELAKDFRRSRGTPWYWRPRLKTRGGAQRKTSPGSGRPRCTTPRTDRWIHHQIMMEDDVNASQIHREMKDDEGKPHVSRQTVLRRIWEAPVKPVRRLEKPLLTDALKQARFEWAEAHLNWSMAQWRHVVYSDESPFHIWMSRKGQIVWIRTDRDDYKKRIESMVKHGGGGFQIWGCFHADAVGPLVRVEGKMNSAWYHGVLTHHAMPFMAGLIRSRHKKRRKHEPIWHYQHDNATPHTAGINKTYLQGKEEKYNGKFKVLEWPSSSPDLNPIENVWGIIKGKLSKYSKKPRNLDELWERVHSEWEDLPKETLERLAQSMPKRVDEGWTIKY